MLKRIYRILFSFFILFSLFSPKITYANELITPSGVPISKLEPYVDQYVSKYIGKTVAGASIVIVKDNRIVFSKGYGYADVKNRISMKPATVLEWGSISKLFVWTAVMQLVEQGKIDLHKDIRNYLPKNFLTRLKYKEPITMLNLMDHNAGFEDNLFDLGYASPSQVKSLEDGLKLAEPAQIYKPGKVVAYSNYGAALAAYIVERVSREKFYQYVNEHIFSESGITHSIEQPAFELKDGIIPNKAIGYELVKLSVFQPSSPFYMSLYPCGGINGTAEDLAKFAIALMPQKGKTSPLFQNNDELNEMLSESYPGIAHGFWEYDGKYPSYTHSGETASFSSNFTIVPKAHFAVITLINQAGETNINFGLTKLLVGDSNKATTNTHMPNSKQLEGTNISARRMASGFLNAYYYFIPLKIKSLNKNEIQVSVNGMSADYVQTRSYQYKMKSGNSVFIAMNTLNFHVKDGKVNQISAPISDYLPLPKSMSLLIMNIILFIFCVLFFLFSPFYLFTKWIICKKRNQYFPMLTKWNFAFNLSGMAIIINVVVLSIRMLSNSNRAYSEVFFQILLNYVFTGTMVISAILMLLKFKEIKSKLFFIFSFIFSIALIYLLFTWHFFH